MPKAAISVASRTTRISFFRAIFLQPMTRFLLFAKETERSIACCVALTIIIVVPHFASAVPPTPPHFGEFSYSGEHIMCLVCDT